MIYIYVVEQEDGTYLTLSMDFGEPRADCAAEVLQRLGYQPKRVLIEATDQLDLAKKAKTAIEIKITKS